MIHVAIVEDEVSFQQQLENYLHRYESEHGESFEITVFGSGQEIVEHYDSSFDLLLMDIEMGTVSGMEAAEIIRKMDQEVAILFITNAPQYAIRGYAVEALDYVLKPISYFAFSERLGRAIGRLRKREHQHILLNLGRGRVIRLDLTQLFYVEVREHILIYHTKSDDFTVNGAMNEVEKQLESKGFFRCNKCYLINLEHVEEFREDSVLVGGDWLQVSRAKKKPFLDAFNNYVNEV